MHIPSLILRVQPSGPLGKKSALSQLPRRRKLPDDYMRQQNCDGVVVHTLDLVLTPTFSVSLYSQIHHDLANKLSFLFLPNELVILDGQ